MELTTLYKQYRAAKLAADQAAKEEDKLKKALKKAMEEAGVKNYTDEDGFLFERIVQNRKSMDEKGVLESLTCYGLGLGIDYILFFYEDRNFCSKKPYLWKITDEMKDEVIRKIHRVNSYLHRREAPPADKDKCTYCRYKEACKRLENAQREREIADTYIPPVGEEGWFNG